MKEKKEAKNSRNNMESDTLRTWFDWFAGVNLQSSNNQ